MKRKLVSLSITLGLSSIVLSGCASDQSLVVQAIQKNPDSKPVFDLPINYLTPNASDAVTAVVTPPADAQIHASSKDTMIIFQLPQTHEGMILEINVGKSLKEADFKERSHKPFIKLDHENNQSLGIYQLYTYQGISTITADKPVALTSRSYYGPADSFTITISSASKGLTDHEINEVYQRQNKVLDQSIQIIKGRA